MRVRLRPIALPAEHGGWGFLVEPIVIGLVAAYSTAGLLLGLAALAVFLLRQPLRLATADALARRRVARTPVAWGVAAAYAVVAALAVAVAAALAEASFWPVLAWAAPLAVVQFAYDARQRSRGLVPELSGAAALAAVAAAMGRAAGQPIAVAVVLWAVAAMRTLPAIVTVRTRVLRLHGISAGTGPALAAHAVAVSAAAALAAAGRVPVVIVAVVVALAGRALWTLRPAQRPQPAVQIGIRELLVGLGAAALLGTLVRPHM